MCVGGVVISHDHMLMIQRGHDPQAGLWSLPGGRVEWGETLDYAIKREVAEETGVDVKCGGFVGLAQVLTESHHFVILDFYADIDPATWPCEPRASSDAADARWVRMDEVEELDLVDGLAAFLWLHYVLH